MNKRLAHGKPCMPAHASKCVARLDGQSKCKQVERVCPPIAYLSIRVIVWADSGSVRSYVFLRRRKQPPGCKGHWRRNMKLVSLYLCFLNVKLPENVLGRPRASPDPGRRPSMFRPLHSKYPLANTLVEYWALPSSYQSVESGLNHSSFANLRFQYAISMSSCNKPLGCMHRGVICIEFTGNPQRECVHLTWLHRAEMRDSAKNEMA